MNSGLSRRLHWRLISDRDDILCVTAERSLASVLDQARCARAKWVVIVRASTDFATLTYYHYVFSFSELRKIAGQRVSWPDGTNLEEACELRKWRASATSRSRQVNAAELASADVCTVPEAMAATRVVDLDPFAQAVAIGLSDSDVLREVEEEANVRPEEAEDENGVELGPFRGVANDAAARHDAPKVDDAPAQSGDTDSPPLAITVSAETEAKIKIGARAMVAFRIERAAAAEPLASFVTMKVNASSKITVTLSVENDAITIVSEARRACDAPASSQAREDAFVIRGAQAGVCRLSVSFWQSGAELGSIGLTVEVMAEVAAVSNVIRGAGHLNTLGISEHDKLTVLVEQISQDGGTRYHYKLYSESLSLDFVSRKSKPLCDRGGGVAASTLQYFEHVYSRLTQRLDASKFGTFEREVAALGVELCKELFDPEVVEILWDLRRRIRAIRVVSWEPYVPWELLRLCNPRTGETDDKFLAEYGLLRGLEGETPPRTLACRSLRYLAADYPCGTRRPIGIQELAFLSGDGPESLRALGFEVSIARPTLDGLSEALRSDADCLHICCHAETDHQSIESAKLLLGDYVFDGEARQIEVLPKLVTLEAGRKLFRNRPIVFLNACETGRVGPSLTSEGGWPNVFLRAGAGVFVGTSWSVRDEPATRFARTFYESLHGGKTLAEAVLAARQSARTIPDASWLAFKVYGDPYARRILET